MPAARTREAETSSLHRSFMAPGRNALHPDHAIGAHQQSIVEIVDGRAHVARHQVESLADRGTRSAVLDLDGQMFLAWLKRAEVGTADYHAGRDSGIRRNTLVP